jgi:hypothetical protein
VTVVDVAGLVVYAGKDVVNVECVKATEESEGDVVVEG